MDKEKSKDLEQENNGSTGNELSEQNKTQEEGAPENSTTEGREAPEATTLEPTAPAEQPVEPTAPVEQPVEPTAPRRTACRTNSARRTACRTNSTPAEQPVEPTAPAEQPVEPTAPAEQPVELTAPAEQPVEPTAPAVEAITTPVEVTPAEEEPTKPKGKRTVFIVAAAALLLVGGLVAGSIFSSKNAGFTPVGGEGLKIATSPVDNFAEDGKILIKGLDAFSLEDLEKNLTIEPSAEYKIEKTSDGYQLNFYDYRNITYAGTFKYSDKAGAQMQDVFTINGPAHTIKLMDNKTERYSGVTLRLSEQVDPRSFEKNVKITPETKVSYSYDLDYVTITPETEWQLTSQYQIEVGSEYTAKTGKQLSYNQVFSFAVVKPEDEGGGAYYPEIIYHNDDNFIITEDVKITISFTGQALETGVPLVLETYKLGDVNKFKDQSKIYLDYAVDMGVLEKVGTEAFAVLEGANRFELNNPGEGSFIVRAIAEDPNKPGEKIEFRTGYLITPYSLYLQSSRNETLAWLHNGNTKAAVEGFTVMFGESADNSAQTDQAGIAVIPNLPKTETAEQSERDYYYYRGEHETNPTMISVYDTDNKLVYYDDASLRKESATQRDLYNSYFFLDRSLYRPTDTINFWGFVKPFRTTTTPAPKTVEITLDPGGFDYKVEATVNENGVFTGTIELDKIKSSHYEVSVNMKTAPSDGQEEDTQVNLGSQYISVKNFQKPTYVLEASHDKEYYKLGDTVNVTVNASFYDGTPLPSYNIETFYQTGTYGDWTQVDDLVTDSNGKATFSFEVQNNSYYETISSNSYRLRIANDGENITNVGSYDYIATDHIIEQTISKNSDNTNLKLEIDTYAIDLNNKDFVKAYEAEKQKQEYFSIYNVLYSPEILNLAKGEPIDKYVNLEIRWEYTDKANIKHENRIYNDKDYYEFDNSYSTDFTYIPKYDKAVIKDTENQELKLAITTVNGKAVIENLIYLPESTEIDFSKDINARVRAESDSVSSYKFYPNIAEFYDWAYWGSPDDDKQSERLSFNITNKSTGEDLTPPSPYYPIIELDVDVPVSFQLMYKDEPVAKQGTILYSIVQGGLYEYKVVNANSFDFTYEMGFSPNALITAAYFDGIRTHYIDDIDIRASQESRTVTIEIESDKDSYRPGEVAKLSIKATDASGKPVEGNMVVSVVDEAIFALSEQYISVLSDLNNNLYYLDNYVSKYCTTYRSGGANSNLWSGGKGDSEGGAFYDSYRTKFKDTAHFVSTRTDQNGESSVEFTMPDNITSWRITAIEIGDQLFAGHQTENIISTLPFFVKPVTSSKYIDGDEIALLVQGHGTTLTEGDEIDYEVTLKGDSYEETLKYKEKAYQGVEFNFGKLPIGTYTLVAKASYSGYSDTVEIPVYVIKNNLELVVNTPIDLVLNQPLSISAARYPVTVSVYSKTTAPFFQTVNRLFGHYCMMPSQRMSRFTAKKVLSGTVDNSEIPYYIRVGNDSIADMQQDDGGIGAKAGEPSELMLSLYLTLIEKEQFNQNSLTGYFEGFRNSSDPKEKAAAYLALAALDKTDKEALLKAAGVDEKGVYSKDDMRTDVKAYYIAALAYIGEDELAKKLYEQDLKEIVAASKGGAYKYKYTLSEAEMISERDLASIWIAASKLDLDDADNLSLYFTESPWMYRTLFESMVYVVNYNRVIETENFSYTLDGQSFDKKIGISGMSTMQLNESQLRDIRFTNLSDGVSAYAYFIGEPEEIGISDSEGMSVTKEVVAVDENTYEVTIKLSLSADAPNGVYDITDWIPSNSRLYDKHKTSYNSQNYSYMTTEEQKVYIEYYHNTSSARTETIKYTIRQTYAASAMLDRVYVIHGESGMSCSTKSTEFVPENSQLTNPIVEVKK